MIKPRLWPRIEFFSGGQESRCLRVIQQQPFRETGEHYRITNMCFIYRLSVPLWTVAHQAPLSMGFSRQEYWNGLPCPPPGALTGLEIEPTSLTSRALAVGFFTAEPSRKPQKYVYKYTNIQIHISLLCLLKAVSIPNSQILVYHYHSPYKSN